METTYYIERVELKPGEPGTGAKRVWVNAATHTHGPTAFRQLRAYQEKLPGVEFRLKQVTSQIVG